MRDDGCIAGDVRANRPVKQISEGGQSELKIYDRIFRHTMRGLHLASAEGFGL